MTSTRGAARPRSWAWTLGWLGLSGPLLLTAADLPSLFGAPLLPWASILVDLWTFTSVFLGVAAIIFARDDLASPPEDRPGFASAGMMLGTAGVAVSLALLVLWLLTPVPF